jgi:hypothetical protein
LDILSRGNLSFKCVSQVLPVDRPRMKVFKDVDRGHGAVAVNGEWVHVEKTNQVTADREAVDDASHAAQPVACGVDCQQRRMLPCGDGNAGLSVSIERGAGVAA